MAALTKAPGEVIIALMNETFCSDILYQLIKKRRKGKSKLCWTTNQHIKR